MQIEDRRPYQNANGLTVLGLLLIIALMGILICSVAPIVLKNKSTKICRCCGQKMLMEGIQSD